MIKSNTSPGIDGVTYDFFKHSAESFINKILTVFNHILLHENVPASFRKSIVVPLFKKEDPNDVSNSRGLS